MDRIVYLVFISFILSFSGCINNEKNEKDDVFLDEVLNTLDSYNDFYYFINKNSLSGMRNSPTASSVLNNLDNLHDKGKEVSILINHYYKNISIDKGTIQKLKNKKESFVNLTEDCMEEYKYQKIKKLKNKLDIDNDFENIDKLSKTEMLKLNIKWALLSGTSLQLLLY